MDDDRIHAARYKGALPMGGAINRSFISAHFLLSAYFLTVQTYKRMRLITRVYSTYIVVPVCMHNNNYGSVAITAMAIFIVLPLLDHTQFNYIHSNYGYIWYP